MLVYCYRIFAISLLQRKPAQQSQKPLQKPQSFLRVRFAWTGWYQLSYFRADTFFANSARQWYSSVVFAGKRSEASIASFFKNSLMPLVSKADYAARHLIYAAGVFYLWSIYVTLTALYHFYCFVETCFKIQQTYSCFIFFTSNHFT